MNHLGKKGGWWKMTSSRGYNKSNGRWRRREGVRKPRILDDFINERSISSSNSEQQWNTLGISQLWPGFTLLNIKNIILQVQQTVELGIFCWWGSFCNQRTLISLFRTSISRCRITDNKWNCVKNMALWPWTILTLQLYDIVQQYSSVYLRHQDNNVQWFFD